MTVRIGVIGTGAIGREHTRRISKVLTGAVVSVVSDVNEAAAQAVVSEFNLDARVLKNAEDVIHDPEVDAVLIASWGPTHEAYVLEAIAAGKQVFCEKPLATTAEGCQNIVTAEVAAGKRLVQVGFMRPFDAGYRALKSVLDSGEIGEPLMVHCAHRNPEVGDSYTTDMAITDTLIHEIDVLRWLLGDDYVSAQVIFPRKTRSASGHLQDPQMILLETAKGIRIDVEVFVNCQYGYDIQCQVVGEKGTANLPEPSKVPMRKNGMRSVEILTDWKQRFIDSYDVELQAFIDGVADGKLTGPSSWDGLAAAITADACVKAQQTGGIVPIEMKQRPGFFDQD